MSNRELNLATLSRPDRVMAVPRPPRRWMTRVGLPLAIILSAASLMAYAARAVLTPAIDVRVAPAVLSVGSSGDMADNAAPAEATVVWVQAPGWVEPHPFASHVAAMTDGVVREVLVVEGDRVVAGQVVASMIDTDAQLELRRAEATRREAESVVVRAEAEAATVEARVAEVADDLARKQSLSGSGAVAMGEVTQRQLRQRAIERELEVARAEVLMAGAVMASRQVECDRAQLSLDRTKIIAPVDGVVLARLIEPGMRLNVTGASGPMAEPREAGVLRIYDPRRLQVRVDVPMAEAGKIAIGTKAEISSEARPKQTFSGEVVGIVHEANIQRNTVQFKVKIDAASLDSGEGVLKPEMLCRVRLAGHGSAADGGVADMNSAEHGTSAGAALWVPIDSIVRRHGERARVWVLSSDPRGGTRVSSREVELGAAGEDGEVEVRAGLRPGDRVVVNPSSALGELSRVRVTEEQP